MRAFLLPTLMVAGCASGSSPLTDSGDPSSTCGSSDLVACSGLCTDTSADPSNCGGCGVRCGASEVCSLGGCTDRCADGLVQCDASCADTSASALHCGGCGRACAANMRCEDGTCVCAGDCESSGDGSSSSGDGAHADGTGSGDGATDPGPDDGVDAGPPPVPGGGYITNGAWKGYAWTATGGMATVRPADYSSVTDFPLCASGTLQPGYANVAMVGWNLNQSSVGVDPPVLTVDPTMRGIYVAVSNPGGTELRLQIQGAAGGASDRWCAIIPGAGGFIAYDAFNTECWTGGDGVPYAGQPIAAALVLVSGKAASAVDFDFCVEDLREADDDGPAPGTGCALTGPGTGTFQITGDDTASVTRDGHNYRVQNNVWNGSTSEQALAVEGVSFRVTKQTQSRNPNGEGPVSYPSVFIGSNFGRSTTNSNLPKQVSALTHVPTAFKWTAANGVYNATYDVWFSSGAGGDSGTPSGGYLMVWLYDPSNVQPIGSPVGTATIATKTFQVWTGTQSGVPIISYVPTAGTINEWSFDLMDFIANARDQFSVVKNSWYLTNVFAGFEIWQQGVGLEASDFCAIVQ